MFHLPYRKSRQCMTPTREGLRRSSRFWMLRRRCMEHSGPMLEQRWLWCGSKGLTSGTLWVGSKHESVAIVTLHVLSLIQGSTIYPSVPPEPRGRREGWQQPQPDSSQCHQRLWSSPEKVSRLVGAAALQGEFRDLPSVFRRILESLNFDSCCNLRRPYSLLHISQISWGRSPREGTSRRRSAWRRSESSSSTSRPLLTLFMRCTIRWTRILITKCDFIFPPVIHLAHGHLLSSVCDFAHLDPLFLLGQQVTSHCGVDL